ncbi:AEC family transporter [Zobellella endophytica]|uniref:AEC family transporter n=1 Tax=Zobellella endophytica TaxID=2116700 RepID=A0A2P7RC38_9GAMM|nr:AEC family transporter [Zobellella endophytica]PSJ47740.1 AEC family transporter [Zobellella endophytica]
MNNEIFAQVFAVTAPVFTMVLLGALLKKIRLIDDAFIGTASMLTFKATMPTLLFLSILQADLSTALQPWLVGYFCLATCLTFAGAWAWAAKRVPAAARGVYVQGAFRGNCGIVSLALAAGLYGDYGLSVGGVMAGLIIVVFNVLSTLVLSVYGGYRTTPRTVLRDLVRNPLIIAVAAGLLGSLAGLSLPRWLLVSGDYFAGITLPIALICVGGSLSLAAFRQSGSQALGASVIKVGVSPLLFTTLAWVLGFEGRELGMLFLFLASPTAAVSYVMAKAAGGDSRLAAGIIALSTLLAAASIMTGLVLMSALALI